MVTLILGKKGSGKTKRLIDMCNAAMAASKGNVVFIEKDSTLTYDLSHKARLAVADSYDIQGFVPSMASSRVCARATMTSPTSSWFTLENRRPRHGGPLSFVKKLQVLSEKANTNLVLSVSADKSEIPAELAELAL